MIGRLLAQRRSIDSYAKEIRALGATPLPLPAISAAASEQEIVDAHFNHAETLCAQLRTCRDIKSLSAELQSAGKTPPALPDPAPDLRAYQAHEAKLRHALFHLSAPAPGDAPPIAGANLSHLTPAARLAQGMKLLYP